jgi:hypothetical protein
MDLSDFDEPEELRAEVPRHVTVPLTVAGTPFPGAQWPQGGLCRFLSPTPARARS